eukprot:TRINITY_DN104_c0_g1_i3.p1 TRINITY_DN104_c0_g1~~TRINITY_DN104_c0_g1_i3.p1  ORF type:complete len:604 (-),score=182.93 TRINITY_DN104_c0_g1_i3:72-1775(-)
MSYRSFLLLSIAIFLQVINHANAANIQITEHTGSSAWWFAIAVSDSSFTLLEAKDSGSYSTYTPMQSTGWGYNIFYTNGQPVTPPVSIRITKGNHVIVLPNIITSIIPGSLIDTGASFTTTPGSGATSAPTTPTSTPVTSAPATQAPVTPSPATQAPVTPSPATQSPVTPAPTTTKPPMVNPATVPPIAPTAKVTLTGNPFAGRNMYLSPNYRNEVESAMATYPSLASKMSKVANIATGYWIDRIAVIPNITTILTQARTQQSQSGKQTVTVLVIYDLPNRDCHAYASNGELQCNGDPLCATGLAAYKTQYIDAIVAAISAFPDMPIVAIVEPDSLPNLATNLGTPKCAASVYAYKTGVSYAVQRLGTLPNVAQYIDAAHGGWLGWETGRAAFASVVASVLSAAGGNNLIRGFATNVANYQPLGTLTSTDDPCNLASQWNFATNEVKYVNLLDQSLTAAGITSKGYVIDTGRNGVPNARSDCSNWCNINKAGLGVASSTNTTFSGLGIIDAYYWVKPPGECDGTSDSTAQRFDRMCASSDSVTNAPQAGVWFPSYFKMVVENSNPAL